MRELSQAERSELEAQIDSCGLRAVLQAIADIADEKSDHIQINWQDYVLAEAWQKAAWQVQKTAKHATVGAIS